MKFANPYTSKSERHSPRWATDNQKPSLCEESHERECDINVIMSRYEKTGQLPQVLGQPLFGDFSETLDYRTAVSQIRAAEEAFMAIPAKVRARFGNDPQAFMEFVVDPVNKEELDRLGLLAKPPTPTVEERTLEALQRLSAIKEGPPQGVPSTPPTGAPGGQTNSAT